jgi:hypothetical protein
MVKLLLKRDLGKARYLAANLEDDPNRLCLRFWFFRHTFAYLFSCIPRPTARSLCKIQSGRPENPSRFLPVNFTLRLRVQKGLNALARTVIEMAKYFHMSGFCRGEFL